QVLFLYGDYAGALAMSDEAEKREASAVGHQFCSEWAFYTSLTLAALVRAASPESPRALYEERLRRLQGRLAEWAEHCPSTYGHKRDLVAAELAALSGDEVGAQHLYDLAIKGATDNEFVHVAALASELAAKFYLSHGHDMIARAYMAEAHFGYGRWGAAA